MKIKWLLVSFFSFLSRNHSHCLRKLLKCTFCQISACRSFSYRMSQSLLSLMQFTEVEGGCNLDQVLESGHCNLCNFTLSFEWRWCENWLSYAAFSGWQSHHWWRHLWVGSRKYSCQTQATCATQESWYSHIHCNARILRHERKSLSCFSLIFFAANIGLLKLKKFEAV